MVEWITVRELNDILNSGRILSEYEIVDLRDKSDYQKEHIPLAKNIPYENFMQINDYSNILSRRKKVIIYCVRGGSSIYAAHKLAKSGYYVKSLIGGMAEYEKYGKYEKFTIN